MDPQKRIDKILDAVGKRVEDEVAGLLGTEFTIIDSDRAPYNKENSFETLMGKQVCAHIDITGDVNGVGCLLVGIKDAIRLGGTLIMLPSSELEEVSGREEYTEEIADSYGEIANIIAGSFSKEFEELYPKSCRFIRKEQEVIVPAKVDPSSDDPVPDQIYYQAQYSMLLEGRQLGVMVMLIPAEPFELKWEGLGESLNEEAAAHESPVSEVPAAEAEVADSVAKGSGPDPEALESRGPVKEEPKINLEKHKKRLDRLLEECRSRCANEVGDLLGTDIELIDLSNELISKEALFYERATGRQVLAEMEVVGDLQEKSYLIASIKDAIQLGAVLIMLPDSEQESVVNREDFNEDLKDAYGEVANIISGVYTAIFEEQYIKKLRFIKKGLLEIQPLKVDIASSEPNPDVLYYASSMGLLVGGKQLGRMQMVFPASLLQLKAEEPVIDKKEEPGVQTSPQSQPAETDNQDFHETSAAAAQVKTELTQESKAKLEKHQKRVDKLLAFCQGKMAEEVGALLGTDVKVTNIKNSITDKEEFFFEQVSGKQVLTKMDVVGDLDGTSYLSVDLKDAIRVGGVLIMLPESELDSAIGEENFSEDVQDAFGEIANIISGVYTAVFEEQYTKKLRFIKVGHELVLPMKVDIDSDVPIPADHYYVSSMDLHLNGKQLGKINLLFPLDLLQLSGLLHKQEESAQPTTEAGVSESAAAQAAAEEGLDNGSEGGAAEILIIKDDDKEAEKIALVLRNLGHRVKLLTFKDNIQNYLPGEVKAIYLVMREVNEQAFGLAIKINSASMVPLIAAGPGWTRTKVIKAVKYGVQDILLTPATKEDVVENAGNNLLKKAA